MINTRLKIVVPLALLISTSINANSLEEFQKQFKDGKYTQALIALEALPYAYNPLASKAYLTGITYSKMQEYDKAIVQFELAIRENNKNSDLYYEYGQALYASNELKKARNAFKTSAQIKFNSPASLYYVAHISQILEEHVMARDYYTRVIKDNKSDAKMKQIAQFQLGETLLTIAREKSDLPEDLNRRVERFILPMLTSAYNLDKRSTLAPEINQRISEVMQEFNLDPNILANGRKITSKRFKGSLNQKIRMDDNVSLVNEENNVQQTKKSSFIFESEAFASYDLILKKRFIISPEARFTFIQHTNQKDSEVYQNDSFIMNFGLKNKFEHKVKNLPASFIFDVDYSRTQKDWQAQKKREYYAQSTTITVGESFNYFDFGDTTFKFKRKKYTGANEAISNNTTVFSADQIIFLPIQHLLIALVEANYIDNINVPSSNTNTYLFRFDYIIPEIFPTYTLSAALGATMTDTLEQKETRGTEMSLNPSIDIAKDLTDKSTISFNFDYTKSKSDSPDYTYGKSVFTAEYNYSF